MVQLMRSDDSMKLGKMGINRATIITVATELLCVCSASAAVIDLPIWDNATPWNAPGAMVCQQIAPQKISRALVSYPALDEKQQAAGGTWHAVISVDLLGSVSGDTAAVLLEAVDPATGLVFAKTTGNVLGRASKAATAVMFSSAQGGAANARNAFDGDDKTVWHSSWDNKSNPPPHMIGIEFGQPKKISGLHYVPRSDGDNGRAKEYEIQVLQQGQWQTVARQIPDRKTTESVDVDFPTPRAVDGYRMLITKDDGSGFGALAELTPKGATLDFAKENPPQISQRLWLEIDPALSSKLIGKKFLLQLSHAGKSAVVVSRAELAQLNTVPTDKLYGRSNGGFGPDMLGAGLLGFDALTEHQQRVLSVMKVRDQSPAQKAGLAAGDVIVGISGRPLPVNDLAPGWNWFSYSHEAFIGRATEAGLRKGSSTITLQLLRQGVVKEILLTLPRTKPFGSLNPPNDTQAAAMLGDMIAYLEKNQRPDGSWSGDIIRTTWSALALLATEKPQYRETVKRAVDWSLAKYPKPESYGNLGFWSGAYAGILYSEWYLLTKDERVLPHLDALRDWCINGQHESIWKVPALGHGPDGLPYGDKALIAPAAHLLVFEALAMRCGMKSGIWELLAPYVEMTWSDPKEGGHGAMGYNRSYKDEEEFWSRSGLCAMACQLRNQRPDMRDALTGYMKAHHPWIRNSHAYGEPGGSWGLLGLNLANPPAFDEVFPQYAWWFSLAWEPGYGLHYTTPHMGSPYMGEDDLINATYALVFQAKKRNLHLTGKKP